MTSDDTQREVEIAAYDFRWPLLFEQERKRILEAAAEAIAEIHHAGSTSVPGLAAKPIIDIVVLLHRPLDAAEIERIAAPGYEYRGEQGAPGRQYFSRRTPPAVHIHAFLTSNPEPHHMLRFRDYLRTHTQTAAEYESLKRSLAEQFRSYRDAYQDAKTDFVIRVNALAAGEQQE